MKQVSLNDSPRSIPNFCQRLKNEYPKIQAYMYLLCKCVNANFKKLNLVKVK